MSVDIYQNARNLMSSNRLTRGLAKAVIPAPVRSWLYQRHFRSHLSTTGNARDVFQRIHDLNWWNSTESRSGPSSELKATQIIRDGLTDWLHAHRDDVKTLLDAPCGDFNWMRYVALPKTMSYIGGEIVPALVHANQEAYGRKDRTFMQLDIAADPLPEADAWLCRDVLFHLPYAMGQRVCEAFLASNTRYFLSTTFPGTTNDEDIQIGWYRTVNLALAPFNLGEPMELLADPTPDKPNRFVGVWLNPKFR